MPRAENRLTHHTLRHLKPDPPKPDQLAHGRGELYARVEPSGAVVFRLRYQRQGKRRRLVLGLYGKPGVSLAEAREKRD